MGLLAQHGVLLHMGLGGQCKRAFRKHADRVTKWTRQDDQQNTKVGSQKVELQGLMGASSWRQMYIILHLIGVVSSSEERDKGMEPVHVKVQHKRQRQNLQSFRPWCGQLGVLSIFSGIVVGVCHSSVNLNTFSTITPRNPFTSALGPRFLW